MIPRYKWMMTINGVTREVHPVYKDDIRLDYEHESRQLFMRGKLSESITFLGEEAERIISAPFETEFLLTLQSSDNWGVTYGDFYECKFYKTDCTVNVDDASVKVKPSVNDSYQEVLDGLEKEYNLIELLPVTESVRMAKRAIIQIYGRGDEIVTNFYGGLSWEQDYDISDSDPADFSFTRTSETIAITIENAPTGMSGKFKGMLDENLEFKLYNSEGVYYIHRVKRTQVYYQVFIKRISDDEPIYQTEATTDSTIPSSYTFTEIGVGNTLETYNEVIGIYCRLLCDVTQITLDGITYDTNLLRGDDPSYSPSRYRYCIGYDASGNVVQSENVSTTPTKWGRKDNTYYYDVPDTENTYYPVGRSLWSTYSAWFKYKSFDYYAEGQARKTIYVNDCFPIWSVISVLLAKVAPNVTFEGSEVYSEFLYGSSNPVSSDYNGVRMMITAKSNILVGEYKEPAMKAPITLKTVFDMLKNAFGCYWFIDESNRLRIEHISWFKNGGSYTMEHQVSIDTTTLLQPTNEKPWSFGTSEYQFDKSEMAARYQFGWMDEVTDVFEGVPYDIVSRFVANEKVEEVTISNFTSDVDYMMIAPEDCSKDGFALLMVKNDGENYLPIEMTGTAGNILVVQNWFGTMTVLQGIFLNWDMPAWTYKQNDVEYNANGIQRNKKQMLTFPVDSIPNLMMLIRTGIGDGQVEKMSVSLLDKTAKTTLKYNTYDSE